LQVSFQSLLNAHLSPEERYGFRVTQLKPEQTYPMNATRLRMNKALYDTWLTPSVAQAL
jgi:hypothetical protein